PGTGTVPGTTTGATTPTVTDTPAAPPPGAPPAASETASVPAQRAEPASPSEHIVYGPERRSAAVGAILAAEGPVLVTTSDPALWAETKDARAKLGPVHVFDPSHLLDTPSRLRWNPTTGCEVRDTAAARAAALLAPVRPRSALDSATADTAEILLRCWLHAAAVDGRPFRQVHRWAQGQSAHEPVRILRTHPKAAGGAAGELESALTGHPERKDLAQELTARALNSLSSIHIRDACNPNRADALAWESFIAEGGTLYVVGEAIEDPRTRPGAMPLLTALVASVVERGRDMAGRSSAGRLDPPLSLVLDDVAAVAPVPSLPTLLSEGPALGLPAWALLRSETQARARWPRFPDRS
ncbi:TraG/TraD/VirD4 family protein, partial [Streptomyces sp. UNOC14_S4]|uniref:TraG/TraD/VirD4 family protein n=1 Tax=Streptomyces sp. UNOC14_S4 TaxID=2872340 RepID=UPI001E45A7D5